jgi:hypothetical protein
MAVYEALLLNTVVPQIQAAQAGDSYVMVVNATTPALRITQTGTGDSILVEDAANPDSSPFVVTAAGDVGIGTSSPVVKLDVTGVGRFVGSGTPSGPYGGQIDIYANSNAVFNGIWVRNDNSGSSANAGIVLNASGNSWRMAMGSSANNSNSLFWAVDVSSPTTLMTLDTSGNLGLGVTPSAWWSGRKVFQFGGSGHSSHIASSPGTVNFLELGSNSFINSSVQEIYYATGTSTKYTQGNGAHAWYTAPSGTAGNTISFTQAMTLDASGNLLVGTTSAPSSAGVKFVIGGVTSPAMQFASTSTGGGALEAPAGAGLVFYTYTGAVGSESYTERARITSGGYFKASNDGSYVGSTGLYHELRQTADEPGVQISATNAAFSRDAVAVRASRNTTNNSFYAISYYNDGAAAYKLRIADSGDVTNTNGTYGTISDQKMKTDIVDAGSQWSDIKALRFRKFKMKDDPSGLVQLGVVAQEVELTSPGLVDEHQDRDAEGNDLGTTTKSVKTSVLLMKAAVALQEAMARIETLEAKVAALKGA